MLFDELHQKRGSPNLFIEASTGKLTFSELYEETVGLIVQLHERGVRPTDRVYLSSRSISTALPVFFAASYLGLTIVYGTDVAQDALGIQHDVLADAQVNWIVADHEVCETIPSIMLGAGSSTVRCLPDKSSEQPSSFVNIYSSVTADGATPRAACFSERSLFAKANALVAALNIEEHSRFLIHKPFCTLSSEMLALAVFTAGGQIVSRSVGKGSDLLSELEGNSVTHAMLSANEIADLLDQLTDTSVEARLSSVRVLAFGPPPSNPSSCQETSKRLDIRWFQGYGQTQTCGPIIWGRRPDGPGPGIYDQSDTEIELSIFDAEGKPVNVGIVGEIGVRGPSVFAGYWEQSTRKVIQPPMFAGDWHRTSDLGRLDAEGRLEVTGRLRRLIMRPNEFNLNCNEVEEIMRKIIGTRSIFVVPWRPENANHDFAIVAYVRRNEDDPTLSAVIDICSPAMCESRRPDFALEVAAEDEAEFCLCHDETALSLYIEQHSESLIALGSAPGASL